MRSVPEGNYLITLQLRALDGKAQRLNFQVKGDTVENVQQQRPADEGIEG